MNTRLLFNISALIEVLTGIAMILVPTLTITLLMGDGIGPGGIAVTRVLGVGLLSLGISTWESAQQPTVARTRIGLCTYNIGVAALLSVIGASGTVGGLLLWPAAGLHATLGATILFALFRYRTSSE